jgi:hypothetical protein
LLVLDALMFYAAASGLALRRPVAGGVMFALAICALVSVGYLFFSPSMRAVFRKTGATKLERRGSPMHPQQRVDVRWRRDRLVHRLSAN